MSFLYNLIRKFVFNYLLSSRFRYKFFFIVSLKFKIIMGKIPQGILGGVSGKVGSVVGSSWKGINVIKSLPLSVANPKTAGQVAQRTKLANVSAFASGIVATIIQPLWNRFAQKASGYNDFVRANIDLFAAQFASPAADLVISQGKMAATNFSEVTLNSFNSTIEIDWMDDIGEGYKLGTDIPYFLCVNETSGLVKVFGEGLTRADLGTGVLPFVNGGADVVRVYMAFKRADGTIVSLSLIHI